MVLPGACLETMQENYGSNDRANAEAFPAPVRVPDEIQHERRERTHRLTRVAFLGVGVRLLIIVIELAGFSYWHYSVLLVDALATIADVVASLSIVVAIRLAQRPPDREHPFGHGRYEPLAGLQLALLISLVGCYLFGQQLFSAVVDPVVGVVTVWACVIPALAALLLEISYRWISRIGKRENSAALVAEATHYRIDAISSLLAAVGLLVATMAPGFGWQDLSFLIDHLFAMLLAAMMIVLGIVAARENLHQLMDRIPAAKWFDLVQRAAVEVPGVLEVEKIRIQNAGPDAHVDIDVEVDPDATVRNAHVIAQHVRARIRTEWPAVQEVVVHIEPYYAGDH
jgi:cation diffusion facilitator family transporter